ncbi:MAG: iron dicitrate transport regulator FecR [Bacillota bacterium]
MKRDEGPYLATRLSRRTFIVGTAALLVPLGARGAADQVHDLRGRVLINNRPATTKSDILAGDRVVTGNDGHFVFVMGQDAFMLRSRSELHLEKYDDSSGLLRLVTGALGAVFGRGHSRTIHAANATAGIRGTGVYMETRGDGTYFCTCWGTVDLAASDSPREREIVESKRHVARLVLPAPKDGVRFQEAPFETHTDEEMDILEKCVGRRSPLVVPDQRK